MPLSPVALEPLLRLALVPGVGPQRLALLVGRFGSAARALAAGAQELASLPGMGRAVAAQVRAHAGPAGDAPLRRALDAMRRAEAVALTPDDLAYPDGFRVLPEPPYLLFAAGRLELLASPAVALVGTRAPSDHGRRAAEMLAGGLARAGYAVVSGMARGIDTLAHRAALDAGGATVGVLGHGLDQVYPPENRDLFRRVREHGLLLSEYPPLERPKAGNFPRRNRLIAALSRGVVVVEMGLQSGAQHTVTYALDQGREVMAVPGPIGEPTCEGSNQLIRDGARVVTSAADVLEELEGVGRPSTPPPALRRPPQPELPLATPDEHTVMGALADRVWQVDELRDRTALSPSTLLATLLELELRGMVESLPGMQFRRA